MNNEENKNKGAAEEPEPEPDDASSTPGAASYDTTLYQRPHPDDRGGGGGKKGNAATSKELGLGAVELAHMAKRGVGLHTQSHA